MVRLLPRLDRINSNNWLSAQMMEVLALHAPKQTFVCGSKSLLDEVLAHVPESQIFSDHLSKGHFYKFPNPSTLWSCKPAWLTLERSG